MKFPAARLALVCALAAPAASLDAQVSTFTVTGSGWLSHKGESALADPNLRLPLQFSATPTPSGGNSIAGGDSIGAIQPQFSLYAGADGFALAEPGRIAASLNGVAQLTGSGVPGPEGPIVVANVSAASGEYIAITHPTLPIGSTVKFSATYHVDGITSSELPNNGPYQYSGYSYPTGTFFFQYLAYTVDRQSLAYNNDAVGSGTYSFPNGLFTSIPLTLHFGQSFEMTGKVGDYLVLSTTLGLGVQDRAYSGYGPRQESHLNFANTIQLNVDAVTPGLTFIANGHNYATAIPEPASLALLAPLLVALRRPRARTA